MDIKNILHKKHESEMIVFDGGPGGGKSSGISYVINKLMDYGIVVLVVPEAATHLITSGFHPKFFGIKEFQREVLRHQLHAEAQRVRWGKLLPHQRVVIIADRGIMSGGAYIPWEEFLELLKEFDLVHGEVLTRRYKGVVHMVTAADGAREHYTLANNAARSETPEQAVELDRRTQKVWVGAQHMAIIGNEGDFDWKLRRLLQEVCRILGIPVPIENERKFVCKPLSEKQVAELQKRYGPVSASWITQKYIRTKQGEKARIRERTTYGHTLHCLTQKVKRGKKLHEHESIIDHATYAMLGRHIAPGTAVLEKDRYCFIYKGRYFEFDVFKDNRVGFSMLELELTETSASLELPQYLVDLGLREVTGDKEYSNEQISRRLARN